MYIIITKNGDFASYAKKMGCNVFTDMEMLVIGKGSKEIDKEVFLTSFLSSLAIDPDVLGYHYIKHILEKCLENSEYYKESMTQKIYPECANYFNVSQGSLERAIRHAITIGFSEVPEMYSKIYNRELKEAPVPAKFVAMMSFWVNNILPKQ